MTTFTTSEKIDITARVIASKLQDTSARGKALTRQIEDVTEEAYSYGDLDLVWVSFIRDFWVEDSEAAAQKWYKVRAQVRRHIHAMRREV